MNTADRVLLHKKQNSPIGAVIALTETERALCWEIDKLNTEMQALKDRFHRLENRSDAA